MDLPDLYDDWRARHGSGWGLSWYLAVEIVRRFAAGAGIVGAPFEHDGLGWYGVMLFAPDATGTPRALGRVTAGGDVERWEGSEHHRLDLTGRAEAGEAPAALLAAAIQHLRLEHAAPRRLHRAGAHVLGLEVCARLAMRSGAGGLSIRMEREPRAREGAPPIHLGSGREALVLTGDGQVRGDGGTMDLLARWRAGAEPGQLADEVALLALRLGLPLPASTDGDEYTLAEHRHRYAAWCAARAAGRGLAGATNGVFRAALEASELPDLLRAGSEQWPASQPAFDRAHRGWCAAAVNSLHDQGVTDATFGRAAKLVAIYLKTLLVCGGRDRTPLARVAHPPIDRVLLKALSRERRFPTSARALWRDTNWTAMDADAYDRIIASLRDAGLDGDGFWRAERWWIGDDSA